MWSYTCSYSQLKKDIKDFVKSVFTIEYYTNINTGTIIHPHNINFLSSFEFNDLKSSEHSYDKYKIKLTITRSTKCPPERLKKCHIQRTEAFKDTSYHIQKCEHCKQSKLCEDL